jgi:peptidoglycan/LPS O-acetylase OafA/YrhL
MINSLTGLRAIAALLVFLFHASVFHTSGGNFTPPGFGIGIVRSGDFGVDIFFILSGYVITYAYGKKMQPFSAEPYLRFLWFRVARLLPTHLATMALMLAAFYITNRHAGQPSSSNTFQFGPPSIISSIFMVNEWLAPHNFLAQLPGVKSLLAASGPIGTPNSVAWSISAEFLVYILFPVIFGLALRSWLLTLGTTLMLGLWFSSQQLMPHDNLIRVVYCFSCGVLASLARRSNTSWLGSAGLIAAAALTGLLSIHRSADGGYLYIAATILAALLITAIAAPDDLLGKFLSTKALVYCGEISYAFYMAHWFAIKLMDKAFHIQAGISGTMALVHMAASFCAAFLLAAIIYQFLEKPARALLQRLYFKFHDRKLSTQRLHA